MIDFGNLSDPVNMNTYYVNVTSSNTNIDQPSPGNYDFHVY